MFRFANKIRLTFKFFILGIASKLLIVFSEDVPNWFKSILTIIAFCILSCILLIAGLIVLIVLTPYLVFKFLKLIGGVIAKQWSRAEIKAEKEIKD